jgi:hypothetical protein
MAERFDDRRRGPSHGDQAPGPRPQPSPGGPAERAVRELVAEADRTWWPQTERSLAFGCPPWLAVRLAAESGVRLRPGSGGNCTLTLDQLTVIGCPGLDGPGVGTLVIQDLVTGSWYDMPTLCHPDVPPEGWGRLTAAVAAGLNPNAAVGLAAIAGTD